MWRFNRANHSHTYGTYEGVEVMGYADSIESALSESTLFVHSARLDAYAVAPLEAMYGGIPSVVTNKTGCRDAISRVDNNLVANEITPDKIASTICWFLELPRERKSQLSERSKQVARQYTEEVRKKEFKQSILDII
ncbi:glycosyltransferase family 4 protein [Halorientalis persicus]|uniref:glycosyltransferase family 4 protein n=1 Tax=Halorientalis persicus TaxID=1367881 RepID=UPI00244E9FAD|nr:glycosyltransferase [Halorientalis persicus]